MSTPSVLPASSSRPSDSRRKTLNTELSIPHVSNFFRIERYYDAAEKVYETFQDLYQNEPHRLNEAYLYGKRYCLFCMDAIPTHNYYNAPQHSKLKHLHLLQTNHVIEQLEDIVARMDQEEQEREKLKELQRERDHQERLDRFQKRMEALKGTTQSSSSQQQHLSSNPQTVQASALSKLELLNQGKNVSSQLSQLQQQEQHQQQPIRRDPSGEPPMGVPSSRYRVVDDSDDDGASALPPPIPPPVQYDASNDTNGLPPPPSYDQIRSSKTRNNHSLGAGSASVGGPESLVVPPGSKRDTSKRRRALPMRTVQDQCRQAYNKLVQQGRSRISGLATYQGRYDDSTNGCTVISALIAANHMMRSGNSSITDPEVVHIIDRVCGPVLKKIRSKLGLGGTHALLIPSDVHDYLVDSNVLAQDYFEGAAGGNVLDQEHMGEFLKLLALGESGKGMYHKAAATFFFKEHVISIVKYMCDDQVCYDLIDSLPASVNGSSMATRTKCSDLEALQVLLQYYTSRKFSDSNCAFIDSNVWDDAMADLDPRVFQGFVWMDNKEPM